MNEKNPIIYLKKIKKEFPSLRWNKYSMITGGWDHDAVILDDTYVFRFPKNTTSKKRILNEAKILGYLQKKISLQIPKPVFVSKHYRFAGYAYIRGKECLPRVYAKMNERQKTAFAEQIGNFLNELHRTPKRCINEFDIPKPSFKEFPLFAEKIRKHVYPKLSGKERAMADAFLQDDYDNAARVLIHGDVTAEHILIDPGDFIVRGIIDFSDMAYADPAMDIAGLWEYGFHAVQDVCSAYGGDKEMLERSRWHYRRTALVVMLASRQKNSSWSFAGGYRMFQERFLF